MDDQISDPFPFAQFPRSHLPFRITRKKMWSALLTEFVAYTGKGEGKNALKLAELGVWPDERLAEVTPVIVPGTEITVDDGWVYGKPPVAGNKVRIFPLESPALFAFNLINGMTNLLEIGDSLAHKTAWNRQDSFAYVRGLFLYMVLTGLSLPRELA